MWILAIILLSISTTFGATYYVNVAAGAGGDGSAGNPWDAISDATAAVVAGDTVIVASGTYAESPTESTDGTSGNYITYVADGTVTITGQFTISGDYVRVIGFTVDRNLGANEAFTVTNTTGVEIWHCTYREFLRNGIMFDSGGGTAQSHRCLIIGNTAVGTFGTPGSTGESRMMALRGDMNLIGYNNMGTLNVDGVYFFGDGNRFINNYIHDPNPASTAHTDAFQTGTDTGGNTFTVIERTFFVDSDTPGEDHHFSNMSNGGADFLDIVMRGNIAHQVGTACHSIFQNWDGVFLYNETYVEAWRFAVSPLSYGIAIFNGPDNIRLFNTIARDFWGPAMTSNIQVWFLDPASIEAHDFNLAFDSDNAVTFSGDFAAEANSLDDVDPLMVDYANDDFRLTSSSPARNAGTSLTLANGGGTGTAVTVDEGGLFRGDDADMDAYGGNLVSGDQITIGTDQVTIVSISGNVLTVTPSITWVDNDPVFYGWDTTPDMGAFPFGAVTLTAATYTSGGTVTPNGDTRWVIQFRPAAAGNPNALVPLMVDSTSPFTFTHQEGDVYRAYPLYASKTTFVQATADAPANPGVVVGGAPIISGAAIIR